MSHNFYIYLAKSNPSDTVWHAHHLFLSPKNTFSTFCNLVIRNEDLDDRHNELTLKEFDSHRCQCYKTL